MMKIPPPYRKITTAIVPPTKTTFDALFAAPKNLSAVAAAATLAVGTKKAAPSPKAAPTVGLSMYNEEFVQPFSPNSILFANSFNSTTIRILLQITDEISSIWTALEKRFEGFRLVIASKVEMDLRTVDFAGNYAKRRFSKDLGRIASGIDTISKPLMSLPSSIQQSEEVWNLFQAGVNPLDNQPRLMSNFDATSTRQRAKMKKKAPQFEKPVSNLAPDALYRSIKTLPTTFKYDYERRVRARESLTEAELNRQLSDGGAQQDGYEYGDDAAQLEIKELAAISSGSSSCSSSAGVVPNSMEGGPAAQMKAEETGAEEIGGVREVVNDAKALGETVIRQLSSIDSNRVAAINLLVNLSETGCLDALSKEILWAGGQLKDFRDRAQRSQQTKAVSIGGGVELVVEDIISSDEDVERAARERRMMAVQRALDEALEACLRLVKLPARLLGLQRFQEIFALALEAAGEEEITSLHVKQPVAIQIFVQDVDVLVKGLMMLVEDMATAAEESKSTTPSTPAAVVPSTWVTPGVERRLLGRKELFLESFLQLEVLQKFLSEAAASGPEQVDKCNFGVVDELLDQPLITMINPSAYEDDEDDGVSTDVVQAKAMTSGSDVYDSVIVTAKPMDTGQGKQQGQGQGQEKRHAVVLFEYYNDVRFISMGPRATALLNSGKASAEDGAFVETTAEALMTEEEKLGKFALTALDVLFFLGETAAKAAGPILVDGGALATSRIKETFFPDDGGANGMLAKNKARVRVSSSFSEGKADGEGKVLSSLMLQKKKIGSKG